MNTTSASGKIAWLSLALPTFLFIGVGAGASSLAYELDGTGGLNSPRSFPLLCGVLLAVLSLVVALQEYMATRAGLDSTSTNERTFLSSFPLKGVVTVAVICAMIVAIPYLGMYLTTALALITLLLLGRVLQLHRLLLVLTVWLLGMYLLFGMVLDIPFPEPSLSLW